MNSNNKFGLPSGNGQGTSSGANAKHQFGQSTLPNTSSYAQSYGLNRGFAGNQHSQLHHASTLPGTSLNNSRSLLYPQLNAPTVHEQDGREERFFTPMQEMPSYDLRKEKVGNRSHLDGYRHAQREPDRGFEVDAYSPHLQNAKRRGLAQISESQQFQTPMQSLRGYRNFEEENSTVKPNLQDTVSRRCVNEVKFSQILPRRSLRLASTQGVLGNQSGSFLGTQPLRGANLLNATAFGPVPSSITPTHMNSQYQPQMFQRNWAAMTRIEGPNQVQERSPQFGGGTSDLNMNRSAFNRQPNINLQKDDLKMQNSFQASNYDLNASFSSQHQMAVDGGGGAAAETHMDFIKKMGFEEKQRAINSCRMIVEDIATEQADLNINDISRQLEKRMPDGSPVLGHQHQYEFEPIQFQASAQALIPQPVRLMIKEAKDLQKDREYLNGLTAVQGLNLRESVGSFVEDHYYIVSGRQLTLWKSATRTEHGVNVFKEGSMIVDASASERQRAVNHLNSEFNRVYFDYPIQRVQYIELYEENFQPCLVVVTTENIQLMRFKKLDQAGNKIDISMVGDPSRSQNANILRQKFDLTKIEASDYAPLTIEEKEEVSKIVQLKKSGTVYYASHTEDFNRTYVKQLLFSGADSAKKVSGRVPTAMQSLARSFMAGSKKKLQSRNVQDANQVLRALRELVPRFIDVFSERKCITDMQVDESRNLLYVLTSKLVRRTAGGRLVTESADQEESEEREADVNNVPEGGVEVDFLGEQAIDVYDLGVFADSFAKVMRVTQEEVLESVQKYFGTQVKRYSEDYKKELGLHAICSMHPLRQSEGLRRALLLTTRNNLRIYISFRATDQSGDEARTKAADLEARRMPHETFRTERIGGEWRVASVHSMPVESEAWKIYGLGAADGLHPNPFRINEMTKQYHHQQHGSETYEYMSKVKAVYCNNSSALIYADDKNASLPPEVANAYLSVSLLTKNEGSYCFARAKQDSQNCINETFSMLQIQKLPGGLDGDLDDQLMDQDLLEQRALEEQEEIILEIRNPNEDSYNLGYLNREIDLNLQKMLGASPALRLDPYWGRSDGFQYMPLSSVEKQVYDAASMQSLKILTNKRHLAIIQLRPIDQLAQILASAADQPPESFSLAEFDAFAAKFTLRELCCMLLQIVSEREHGQYYYSRKVNQAIALGRQSERRHQYAKAQKLGDRSGQLSHMQPRQFRGLSSTQLKRSTLGPTHRSLGSNLRFNFGHSAGFGPNQMAFEQDSPKYDGPVNSPYVFNHSEEFPAAGQALIQNPRIGGPQGQSISDVDIIREMYSPQNEINGNCSLQLLGRHRPAIDLARSLLTIYGDSVCLESCHKVLSHYKMQSQKMQAIQDPRLLTLRFGAIFSYLQRILRPIWDSNLTLRQSKAQPMERQKMNVEVFEPAVVKLINLLNTVESCQKELLAQTSAEDQAKMLGQDLAQARSPEDVGIQSGEIHRQVRFTFTLENQVREKIEQSHRKVLKSLLVFMRRCIDAIQFLKVVSFHQYPDEATRRELFLQMLKQIQAQKSGAALLRELSETKYKDLVLQGGGHDTLFDIPHEQALDEIIDSWGTSDAHGTEKSRLIRKLYDGCIHVAVGRENKQGQAIPAAKQGFNVQSAIQQRALQIQKLCPTMFTQSQTTTFVGQSILHQAVSEKDMNKRATLIEQGLDQLLKLPQNINLQAVVPDLCKTHRYAAIIVLCMRKIQQLQKMIEESKTNQQARGSGGVSVAGSSTRNRLNMSMQSASSQHLADMSRSQTAIDEQREQHLLVIEECYSVIINLFLALHNSIQDLKDSQGLCNRVELLLELKKHQKDGQQSRKYYQLFYNHFTTEVGHSAQGKSSEAKELATKAGKVRLRREIIHQVESYGDSKLLKVLFLHMIGQPRDYIHLEDLPHLDFDTFLDVCRDIFQQPQIQKTAIDTLVKLMRAKDEHAIGAQGPGSGQQRHVRHQVVQRLCELVLRLCEGNELVIVKAAAGSKAQSGKEQEVIHLSCQEKIDYCQGAIDEAQSIGDKAIDDMSVLATAQTQTGLAESVKRLQQCIETLRFQQKVISAFQERITWMQTFEAKANDKLKSKIKEKIEALKNEKKALDTLNCAKNELYNLYVERHALYGLMYERVRSEQLHMENLIQYDESNDAQKMQIGNQYLSIFDSNLKEVAALTHDSVELKFNKAGTDHLAARKWKNSEVMQQVVLCFKSLRSYNKDREVGLLALRKIISLKIGDFMEHYGHDDQQAFNLLQSLVKDIIDKGEVAKSEEFAVLHLVLEAICQQNDSVELRADDVREILEEMYEQVVSAHQKRRSDPLNASTVSSSGRISLEANLILCHILVHAYHTINIFIKNQKAKKLTAGQHALAQETKRRLSPAAPPGQGFGQPAAQLGAHQSKDSTFDHALVKIEQLLCDFELQLPKDYSDTMKKFIEVIRKDAQGAKR